MMTQKNDDSEEDILRSYEQDEWRSVEEFKKLKEEYSGPQFLDSGLSW